MLVIGLGFDTQVLGLGLVLASLVLGLGFGLAGQVLVNITGARYVTMNHRLTPLLRIPVSVCRYIILVLWYGDDVGLV